MRDGATYCNKHGGETYMCKACDYEKDRARRIAEAKDAVVEDATRAVDLFMALRRPNPLDRGPTAQEMQVVLAMGRLREDLRRLAEAEEE